MFGLYIAGAVVYMAAVLFATAAMPHHDKTVRVITLVANSFIIFLLIWGVFHS